MSMLKQSRSQEFLYSVDESRQTYSQQSSFYNTPSVINDTMPAIPPPPYSGVHHQKSADRHQQRNKDDYTEISKLVPSLQSESRSMLEMDRGSDLSRLNVSFEGRDFMYLGDKVGQKDSNANYRRQIKYDNIHSNNKKTKTGYMKSDLAYKAYMSDNEGMNDYNRYRRSIPTVPNIIPRSKSGGPRVSASSKHDYRRAVSPDATNTQVYSSEDISPPKYSRNHNNNYDNTHHQNMYDNTGIDQSIPPSHESQELVEDLYTIPHTFDHHKVTRQLPHTLSANSHGKNQPSSDSHQGYNNPQRHHHHRIILPPPPTRRPLSEFATSADDPRRRTWSPPTFSRMMAGNGGVGFSGLRSYRSNDQLDDVAAEVLHEEQETYSGGNGTGGPPRLAPVSGKLEQNAHQSLIKPIAFKPVVLPTSQPHLSHSYGASPSRGVGPGPISPRPQHMHDSPPQIFNNGYEAMRAKTLSPYELNTSTMPSVNGVINGGYEKSVINMMANKNPHQTPSPPKPARMVFDSAVSSNNNNVGSGNKNHGTPPNYVTPPPSSHQAGVQFTPSQPHPNSIIHPQHQHSQYTQQQQQHHRHHHPDDGYISQEYHSGSHCHSNSSHSNNSHNDSVHNDSDRSIDHSIAYMNNSVNRPADRPESLNSSNVSRVSSSHLGAAQNTLTAAASEVYNSNIGNNNIHTPSPSDSGVGELELMLRDKDSTIQHLRDIMEKNETAILQVCAEKERSWELELSEMNMEWERRWRHHQQKAFKMEQALLMQLFKLQQERKALKLDLEKLKSEKDSFELKFKDCQEELKQTKAKLEEVNWGVCQKSGEISLLKSQLKDSKDETTVKRNEVVNTKCQLKTFQKTSDEKDHEILTLEAELKRRNEELTRVNTELSDLKQGMETVKKEVFNAQQKADLKELQLDMKTKEFEKLHIEQSRLLKESKVKSSPVGSSTSSGSSYNNDGIIAPVSILKNNTSNSNNIVSKQPGTNASGASSQSCLSKSMSSPTVNGLDEVTKLRLELEKVKSDLSSTQDDFKRERDQWLEEKNKVIRYQKHLQLNYVQMYRKNKMLESEVEQLTLELEKRDICLMDGEAGKIIQEGEESMC